MDLKGGMYLLSIVVSYYTTLRIIIYSSWKLNIDFINIIGDFSLFYEPEDFYTDCKQLMDNPNGGVSVARGWSVTRLDPVEKIAYLENGTAIHYNKCLIATGK